MRINLAARWLSEGIDVDIVVRRAEGELRTQIPPGARLIVLDGNFVLGLWRYLTESRPTHLLSSYEDISAIALLLVVAARLDVRTLISSHNSFAHVSREGSPYRRLKYLALRTASRFLYHRADSLVAVSEGLRRELAAWARVPLSAIEVIYNPVVSEPQSLKAPDHIKRDGDEKIIGFFGRLHPQKRIDLLISALAKCEFRDSARLLIAGSGTLQPHLERLCRDLGVSSRVEFVGHSPDPLKAMKQCDLIVLPSDYEGFGNVLVEAMSVGVQVISSDCPHGPSEILEGGALGQLFPPGDVDALARAIERSLSRDFWVDPGQLIDRSKDFSVERAWKRYSRSLGLSFRGI